jgi:hypothetical protein
VWQAGVIHVWDLDSRACVRTFEVQNGVAAFTPDGRYLVVNPLYGPCQVIETGSWTVIRELESEPAGVAVSWDGSLLAAAALPSGVALFRMPGFEAVASLRTEGALMPGDLLFSPDGNRLAVLQSQRVLIWDLGVVREELLRLGLAEGLPRWTSR